mmetsp:Transcript_58214/g.160921  ORF Transcript_58214/g.160921 Transcript_58214/m.160921 type:complete len:261 (-) Transcript_58214:1033-1815(-)
MTVPSMGGYLGKVSKSAMGIASASDKALSTGRATLSALVEGGGDRPTSTSRSSSHASEPTASTMSAACSPLRPVKALRRFCAGPTARAGGGSGDGVGSACPDGLPPLPLLRWLLPCRGSGVAGKLGPTPELGPSSSPRQHTGGNGSFSLGLLPPLAPLAGAGQDPASPASSSLDELEDEEDDEDAEAEAASTAAAGPAGGEATDSLSSRAGATCLPVRWRFGRGGGRSPTLPRNRASSSRVLADRGCLRSMCRRSLPSCR